MVEDLELLEPVTPGEILYEEFMKPLRNSGDITPNSVSALVQLP